MLLGRCGFMQGSLGIGFGFARHFQGFALGLHHVTHRLFGVFQGSANAVSHFITRAARGQGDVDAAAVNARRGFSAWHGAAGTRRGRGSTTPFLCDADAFVVDGDVKATAHAAGRGR